MTSCTLVLAREARARRPEREYRETLLRRVAARVDYRVVELPVRRPVLSKYRYLGRFFALSRSGGLVHVDQPFLPLLAAVRARRCVVSVRDLCPSLRPDLYPGYLPERADARLAASGARRAAAILVPSEFQRTELAEQLPFPFERIFVARFGIDHAVFHALPEQERRRLRAGFCRERAIPEDTELVLSMSSWIPRKNVAGSLLTVRALLDRGRDVRLVMRRYADTRSLWRRPIERLLCELRLEPHVVWLPEPRNDTELAGWFRVADVLLFPTFYEGFGSPPLEAMACGCPVVASDATTMPEVVGDAGLLVPPEDVSALADSVEQVLDDAALRAELLRRGVARAATFTWDDAVEAHLRAYAVALAGP